MTRACVLLATVLMGSALLLVTARFEARELFVALERMKDQARDLETDWRGLQLERAREARHARIDHVARQILKMTPRIPERVLYITKESQP